MGNDLSYACKLGAETAELLRTSRRKPKLQTFSGENFNGKQQRVRGWQLYAETLDSKSKEGKWQVCETTILGEDGVLYHRRTPHLPDGSGVVSLQADSVFMTDRILKSVVNGLNLLRRSVS